MTTLGIDFGHTKLCVYAFDDNHRPVFAHCFPSVVWRASAFAPVVSGIRARSRLSYDPAPIVNIKPMMGTDATVMLGGESTSPSDLVTHLLRHVRSLVQEIYEDHLAGVVITIPAYFDFPAQRDLSEAAVSVFFGGDGQAAKGRLALLQESEAVALAYTFEHEIQPFRALLLDLGSGAFEATIFEKAPYGGLTVSKGQSDTDLGSGKMDDRVAAWFLYLLRGGRPEALDRVLGEDRYPSQTRYAILQQLLSNDVEGLRGELHLEDEELMIGERPRYALALDASETLDAARLRKLKVLAEKAKIELTVTNQTAIVDQHLFEDHDGAVVELDVMLHRSELEALIGDLIEQMVQRTASVLSSSGLRADQIDRILLVGAAARMPVIRDRLQSAFGRPVEVADPHGILVAHGAALRARDMAAAIFPRPMIRPSLSSEEALDCRLDEVLEQLDLEISLVRDPHARTEFARQMRRLIALCRKAKRTFPFDLLVLAQLVDELRRLLRVVMARTFTPSTLHQASEYVSWIVSEKENTPIDITKTETLFITIKSQAVNIPSKVFKSKYVLIPINNINSNHDDLNYIKFLENEIRIIEPKSIFDLSQLPAVLGTYSIIRVIEKGGFSIILLAQDVHAKIDHRIVLKVLLDLPHTDLSTPSLLAEAQIWKFLSDQQHANILRFDGLQQISGHIFFVTEYMDGGNLASVLHSDTFEHRIHKLLQVLEAICQGIAFIHRQRIIHGDIKPQNILVSSDLQRVKIGDFGLAAYVDDTGRHRQDRHRIMGTMAFLAPESFHGVRSFQTDIYALGLTLYVLLTAQHPFSHSALHHSMSYSQADFDILKKERLAFTPNLRAINASVPAWLAEAIERCLAPFPQGRFADAIELLETIEPWLKRPLVVLAVHHRASNQIEYDLDVRGQRSREMLTIDIPEGMIPDICRQWNALGELALERIDQHEDGQDTADLDQKIKNSLRKISEWGSQFILGNQVRDLLAAQRSSSLWLIYDPHLAAIPWELLHVGDASLCRTFPMARWPRLMRPYTPPLTLRPHETIRVLLIANPSGDLRWAADECEKLEREFRQSPIRDRLDIRVVDPLDSTFDLCVTMQDYHIVHYAGHAVFSEQSGDLRESGWLLKGSLESPDSMISAKTLETFWTERAPMLVFANACSTARASALHLKQRVYSDASIGLAQAFLAAGVQNYIGTVWDAPDDLAAAAMASEFYQAFFAGKPIGEALRVAREKCVQRFGEYDLTWARYALFGDPLVQIPLG